MESKYIYIYIFMFRQQKPSSVGWHSIEWWQVITWFAFIVGSCHNEWTAPQLKTGGVDVSFTLNSHPFSGVFSGCLLGMHFHRNTPKATPPNQLNGFVPRLLFSFLVHLLEDVRILEKIREHHSMPRFASKPMALKYITIHLRNIYLKSYIIWPIFHKLFSFSKATWSREFFPHEMHLKPHLTTSNNTKPSPYYPYTIHPIQWHFQFGNATTAVR